MSCSFTEEQLIRSFEPVASFSLHASLRIALHPIHSIVTSRATSPPRTKSKSVSIRHWLCSSSQTIQESSTPDRWNHWAKSPPFLQIPSTCHLKEVILWAASSSSARSTLSLRQASQAYFLKMKTRKILRKRPNKMRNLGYKEIPELRNGAIISARL